MEKLGKFIVSVVFVMCFAIAIALIIDVCGYVRTTGEVVAVEATGVGINKDVDAVAAKRLTGRQTSKATGDYKVTYEFQTKDGEHTAYGFTKDAPQIGDSTIIRYERRNPIMIRKDEDFISAYIAIASMGVATVCVIGDVLRQRAKGEVV